MTEPFTYTNRKGRTYYLRQVGTKSGKTRYVFSKAPGEGVLEAVPHGYEVSETLNGVLSLVKAGPTLISQEELGTVVAELRRHRRLDRHAAENRRDAVVVCEPIGGLDPELAHRMGFTRRAAAEVDAHTRYSAILRFRLVDASNRQFTVDRWCFLGGIDGWMGLHEYGALGKLARAYIPHLGKESFFELM